MQGHIGTNLEGDPNSSINDSIAHMQMFEALCVRNRNLPFSSSILQDHFIHRERKKVFSRGASLRESKPFNMTLNGKTILKLSSSTILKEFKRHGNEGKPSTQFTEIDEHSNNDLFLLDDSISDRIHKIDKKNNNLSFLDRKNAPFGFEVRCKFAIAHPLESVCINRTDHNQNPVLQMPLNKNFQKVAQKSILFPAYLRAHEDLEMMVESGDRTIIPDKIENAGAQINENEEKNEIVTDVTPPSKRRIGITHELHGFICNAKSNFLAAELKSSDPIKSLNNTPASKKREFFNGKNFTGWKLPLGNKKANWYTIKDKILQIRSGPQKKGSILWTRKSYEDFIIEFEFRFVHGVIDSGIHLRNQDQIQLGISGSLKRDMTGSPYIPGKGYPIEARRVGELLKLKNWNLARIQAIGPNYTVWLQGVEIMNYTSDSAVKKGPIGIQLHGKRKMGIDFQNLRIHEL